MKLFIILLTCACFSIGGYYTQLQEKSDLEKKITEELMHSDKDPPKRSLVYAISVIAEKELKEKGIQPTGMSAVEQGIEKLVLTEREHEITRTLGSDPIGQRFSRVLIAEKHTTELPGSEQFLSEFYQDLKKHPGETFEQAKILLGRTPLKGFAPERAAFLTLMDNSNSNPEVVKSQSLDEMTQNIMEPRPDPRTATSQEELNQALSVTPESMLPITAHSLFLKHTPDPTEALSGTIRGILAQTDYGVRSTLANQLLTLHPTLKENLSNILTQNNINLALGKER